MTFDLSISLSESESMSLVYGKASTVKPLHRGHNWEPAGFTVYCREVSLSQR